MKPPSLDHDSETIPPNIDSANKEERLEPNPEFKAATHKRRRQKPDPFFKKKQEWEERQKLLEEERKKKKQERKQRIIDISKKNKQRKHNHEVHMQRTKKGQPIVRNMMQDILNKLQKEQSN